MVLSLLLFIASFLSLLCYRYRKLVKKYLPCIWKIAYKLLRHIFTITDRKITLSAIVGIAGFSSIVPISRVFAYNKTGNTETLIGFDLSNPSDMVSIIGILSIVIVYSLYVFCLKRHSEGKTVFLLDSILDKLDEIKRLLIGDRDCQIISTDSDSFEIHPVFKNVIYSPKPAPSPVKTDKAKSVAEAIIKGNSLETLLKAYENGDGAQNVVQPVTITSIHTKTNKSLAPFAMTFWNSGKDPLDDVHIFLNPSNEEISFYDTNVEYAMFSNLADMDMDIRRRSRYVSKNNKEVHISIDKINGGMIKKIIPFYIRVPYDCKQFQICWSVNARSFKKNGTIDVSVESQDEYRSAYSLDGTRYSKYEDYYVINEEENG